MKRCHRCRTEWASEKKQPSVKEVCPHCSAYLHCCLNCRFHEPGVHNDCHIPTTEWVGDKIGCNFCDEFEFVEAEVVAAADGAADQARETFDKLFGMGDHKKEEERPNDFNRLFGE